MYGSTTTQQTSLQGTEAHIHHGYSHPGGRAFAGCVDGAGEQAEDCAAGRVRDNQEDSADTCLVEQEGQHLDRSGQSL